MKDILIIVVSERKGGNCDLLARYAEKLSNDEIRIKSVYLKDFNIKQCQGCMSCVFKSVRCKLEDDLYNLIDIINDADGLILIAPTYVLTIPGKLKLVMDRFLCLYSLIKDKIIRPAISIGVTSPIDWNQLQLPLMNIFLLELGCKIIDSHFVFGAGQGEVLLTDAIDVIKDAIYKLKNYQNKQYESCYSEYCPVDYCKFFEKIDSDKYRCPICLTPVIFRGNKFYFDENDLNNNRWTKEKMREHFEGWILCTKGRFLNLLPQIYRKKKDLGL